MSARFYYTDGRHFDAEVEERVQVYIVYPPAEDKKPPSAFVWNGVAFHERPFEVLVRRKNGETT